MIPRAIDAFASTRPGSVAFEQYSLVLGKFSLERSSYRARGIRETPPAGDDGEVPERKLRKDLLALIIFGLIAVHGLPVPD